uniref:Membrane cofactor protein-like isoform X2 n=1 Tax=Phascolarctos cinereus TaxID=38626 RepID=A0A6P5JQY9_PHACI|nr:membrane cofactor protein-like isoform X2 [Phascolarctos cinereus]
MGACPRPGAWLRSVGFLGALALLALPQASGDCNAPDEYTNMALSEVFRERTCPYPYDLEHGQIHIPDASVGSQITYSCNEGYTLIGNVNRNCELHGQRVVWTGADPFCKINTCERPPRIENGKHSDSHRVFFTYGESVTYHCHSRDGYHVWLIGNPTIFCDKDGEWNKLPPKCKEVKCETPKVDNAVQLTGFGSFHTYKDTIVFKCEDGYFFLREPPNKEPPYPSRPGSTDTSQQEPPVSSQPGPSLPPNKEPQGFGIIIVIVLTIVIVFSMISFIAYRRYKEK